MRPASKGWENEYRRGLVSIGFTAGRASLCCFYREIDGVRCAVRGGGFTVEEPTDALTIIPDERRKFWLLSIRGLLVVRVVRVVLRVPPITFINKLSWKLVRCNLARKSIHRLVDSQSRRWSDRQFIRLQVASNIFYVVGGSGVRHICLSWWQ